LDCRHVCKTCDSHDTLQAGKHKEVHPPYSPDLAPAGTIHRNFQTHHIYVSVYIYIYSVQYYARFHVTALVLGTYYPWIREHYRASTKILLAYLHYTFLIQDLLTIFICVLSDAETGEEMYV
jgi:hypothetical protein